jgi:ADP-ribosylglycohydrolase
MELSLDLSFPVQSAFFPLVDKAHDQNGQENQHGHKASQTYFFERNRPREQESDFQIEQDEQDGHQVVAHIELHARVFESFEAAFIGGIFFRVRFVGAKDVAQNLGNDADSNADQNEQENGEVLFEVHLETDGITE